MNLPSTFEEKMKSLLGEEYEAYLPVSYTHLTLPTMAVV